MSNPQQGQALPPVKNWACRGQYCRVAPRIHNQATPSILANGLPVGDGSRGVAAAMAT
jgi:hypothetical protein